VEVQFEVELELELELDIEFESELALVDSALQLETAAGICGDSSLAL